MVAKTKTQLERENKEQVAAFRKAARELGCDQDEERFKDALRTVAKHKPDKSAPKTPSDRRAAGKD